MHRKLTKLCWLLLVGCGSSARPAAPAAGPSSVASAPTTAPAKPSVESQRDSFMAGCSEQFQSDDYCDCSFAQFSVVFRDADFTKEIAPDDPRMIQLGDKITQSCTEKYPEVKAMDEFVQSCTEHDARLNPYCNCAWTELRKSLSVSEILTYRPPGTPKWNEAKKTMPKACKGKIPSDLGQLKFVGNCLKDGQSSEKKCQCQWKKLNRKFSVEQVIAGTADLGQVPDLDKCK